MRQKWRGLGRLSGKMTRWDCAPIGCHPGKIRVHPSGAQTVAQWVPAFAGMTILLLSATKPGAPALSAPGYRNLPSRNSRESGNPGPKTRSLAWTAACAGLTIIGRLRRMEHQRAQFDAFARERIRGRRRVGERGVRHEARRDVGLGIGDL